MLERYSDKYDVFKKQPDFIVRKHVASTLKIFLIFLSAFAIILGLSYYTIVNEGSTKYLDFGMIILIFISLCFYVNHSLKDANQIINAAEFQNAIFASALRAGYEICAVFTIDGDFLYYNNSFYKIFAQKTGFATFEDFLNQELFSEDNRIELRKGFTSKTKTKIEAQTIIDNKVEKIHFLINPYALKENEQDKRYILLAGMIQIFDEHEVFTNIDLPIYAVTNNKLSFANPAFAKILKMDALSFNIANLDITSLIIKGDVVIPESGSNYGISKIWLNIQSYNQVELLSAKFYESNNNNNITSYHILYDVPQTAITMFQENDLWYFFEDSPIAKVIINSEGIIEKANRALSKLLIGDEKFNIIQHNLFNYVIDDQRLELIKIVKSMTSGDNITNNPLEAKLISNKNALLYIKNLSNNNLGVGTNKIIIDFIDTTEQKTLEMHFVHSQKMQAVGQLAGGIAHDFNNLLTAMIGFSDLLLMRHPPGDQSFADIMQIKQNASRAANLVRQLLAFSRKQVLQPQILDVGQVLSESANLIRRLIGESIELVINHERDLKLVKVDQGQLEQVIINLAVNARDAMSGNGILTIQTSNVVISKENPIDPELFVPFEEDKITEGEYILIQVSDTGSGIPRNIISKVFEPFFSTKEVGAGTGLGLSTVYGIVKQTGGSIYLKTSIGKGTSFSIFLKSYDHPEEKSEPAAHLSSDMVTQDLTGSGTILIVEDEEPVRLFSTQALTNKGYKMLEAVNGEDALKVISDYKGKIDVIISDVIMPGMNGPEMVEKILAQYPDIKVIFISGYTEDALSKDQLDNHQVNFLAKPFTLKQLASKVKEVITPLT